MSIIKSSCVLYDKVDALLCDANDTRVHQALYKNWHSIFSLCCVIDHKQKFSIHTNPSFYMYVI